MSFGLERAGVYVPRFSFDGRPIASPDEDPFTIAVTAIESVGDAPPPVPPRRVHLVGAFPEVAEWGFGSFLGGPVESTHHDGGPKGFRAAVESALAGPGDGPTWVVAAERAGRTGAVGVALRFGPRPASRQPDWDQVLDLAGAASLASAVADATAADVGERPRDSARGPPWSREGAERFFAAGLGQVSEGAYVPRARYLENLPSRWRLEADRCGRCRHLTFPRRGVCRACGSSAHLATEMLPRDGARVVAATVIAKGGQPTEFDPQVAELGPYAVILAELAPGVRLTLQVTDAIPGELPIGARVGTRIRRLYPMEGEWRYGRKAVPLLPNGAPG